MSRRSCVVHYCDLQHFVTLQKEVRTADGGGGYALSWQDVVKVRAQVKPLSGRERLAAMKLEASVTHKVVIRYRDGVTAAMRLLFRGRPLNIRSVINVDEFDTWLELLVEEGVAT